MSSSHTTFNDPIHHTIEVHPLCLKIVDTPEFQRLRSLRQCGICYLVFPSAMHSRFEHSIGVYHLAAEMVEKLKKLNPTISDEEVLCVKIGALVHDLGHGPFSHLWEHFVNSVNHEEVKKWKHETMSLKLFDHLLSRADMREEFEKFNLNDYHIQLIKAIIIGDPDFMKQTPEKQFLLEIVANKKTNIDVDRWDYMKRDAYFFGVPCPVSFDRIISYVSAKEIENGECRIAFRDKVITDLFEIFKCRMKLHKICYQHKVCRNLEMMVLDVLTKADDHFFENKGLKLSNSHEDIETYLSLNDGLMNTILYSKTKSLEEARNILKRIQSRNLYSLIGNIYLKKTLSKRDLKILEESLANEFCESPDNYRLCIIDVNMGIEGDDPFKQVILYNKQGDIVPPEYMGCTACGREICLLAFSVNEVDLSLKKDIMVFLENCLTKNIIS